MFLTSDKGCVSYLRLGGGNICQLVEFFRLLADFVIMYLYLLSFVPIPAPRCCLPSVDI